MSETTKKCKCGNTKLVLIRTQQMKMCGDCGAVLPWRLAVDQKPVGYKG